MLGEKRGFLLPSPKPPPVFNVFWKREERGKPREGYLSGENGFGGGSGPGAIGEEDPLPCTQKPTGLLLLRWEEEESKCSKTKE